MAADDAPGTLTWRVVVGAGDEVQVCGFGLADDGGASAVRGTPAYRARSSGGVLASR